MFLAPWPAEFEVEGTVLALFLAFPMFAFRTPVSFSETGDESSACRSKGWLSVTVVVDWPLDCEMPMFSAMSGVVCGRSCFNMNVVLMKKVYDVLSVCNNVERFVDTSCLHERKV